MDFVAFSDVLGVEVRGIDLRCELSSADATELRRLFAENHLILFRGQDLTAEDQIRVSRVFGPLMDEYSDGDYHTLVSNKAANSVANYPEGLAWHQDASYLRWPFAGLALYAVEVARDSTPTLFASLARAWRLLSDDLRRRLEDLEAVHLMDFSTPKGSYSAPTTKSGRRAPRLRDLPADAGPDNGYPRSIQPVVVPHPATGIPLLYVDEVATGEILGLSEEESDSLLDRIRQLLYDDDNIATHHWEVGDLIVWDNIAVQHNRPRMSGTAPRTLRRTVIADEETQASYKWAMRVFYQEVS
jgi:taurine dioxygenase